MVAGSNSSVVSLQCFQGLGARVLSRVSPFFSFSFYSIFFLSFFLAVSIVFCGSFIDTGSVAISSAIFFCNQLIAILKTEKWKSVAACSQTAKAEFPVNFFFGLGKLCLFVYHYMEHKHFIQKQLLLWQLSQY